MNRQRAVILLGSLLFVIAAALIVGGSRSAAASLSKQAPISFTRSELGLQCNIKVRGGLAQCGSQASSCKNCHEVKGQDPVNTQGDWHVSHAFGDFCEFCHGGNVQAVDKAAAHEGMLQPLGDVKTNCSSCHADEYQAKAEPYAKILGVMIGAGSGSPQAPATPSGSSAPAPQQPPAQPAPQTAPQPAPAATPTSSETVDYVAQYRAAHPAPLSAGTIVTSLLLALTVVGGGTFVFWNEKHLRLMLRSQAGGRTANAAVTAIDERKQELARLLPMLETLDAQTLRALRTLLSGRR